MGLSQLLGVVGDRAEIQGPIQLGRPQGHPVFAVGLDAQGLAPDKTVGIPVRGPGILGVGVLGEGGVNVGVAEEGKALGLFFRWKRELARVVSPSPRRIGF